MFSLWVYNELKLKDRTYVCPKCGHVMDRDYQAAVNIDKDRVFLLTLIVMEKEKLSP